MINIPKLKKNCWFDLGQDHTLLANHRVCDSSAAMSNTYCKNEVSPQCVARPEEINDSYLILLQQVSRYEATTADLKMHIQSLKADAIAYAEVAHELEMDLKAATCALKTKGEQLVSVKKRLALAEQTIRELKVCAAAVPSLPLLPSLTTDAPLIISDKLASIGSSQIDISPTSSVDAALSALRAHLSRDLSDELSEIKPEIPIMLPVPTARKRRGTQGTGNKFSRTMSAISMVEVGNSMMWRGTGKVTVAYSTTSPLEKVSSDLPPLRRCFSVPTTLGEQMVLANITIDCDLLQDPTTSLLTTTKDFCTDSDEDPNDLKVECEPKCLGLLPVQANHMQNKSLRHVSDTDRFWWVFQRQKSNLQNGYKGRKRASAKYQQFLFES